MIGRKNLMDRITRERRSQRCERELLRTPQNFKRPRTTSFVPDTLFELYRQLRFGRQEFVSLVVSSMCFFAAIDSPCLGEESAADARIIEALEITTDAAKLYEFQLRGDTPKRLDFDPNSVLRWSNPEAGEIYGNVFLWTHDGRPEVVGSFLQWYSPFTHGSHEFQSLSTKPVVATRGGTTVWTTDRAGIVLAPVPDSREVAATVALRMRQARTIARGFRVRKTDRDGKANELRLLVHPLARYGNDASDVLDGALFAFVQGTDPEAFLLLEARTEGNQWQWQYALVQMNSVQFEGTYREEQVWQTDIWPWAKVQSGRETYTSFGPFNRRLPIP